jgi:hypothetical protein
MIIRNSKQELIEMLTEDDLSNFEDLYLIYEACGLEIVKLILLAFSDNTSTIKKPSLKAMMELIKKYISQHQTKSDKQIATDLSVSENYIYKLRNNYKF